MKLGIVTIWDMTNYGNQLQNYAVSYVLKNRFHCKATTLVAVREKAFYNGSYVAWIKDRIAKKCCVVPALAEKKWGPNITRWANFYNWSRKHIPVRTIYSHESLPESLNQEYDLFLAGSDQIWNYLFSGTKYDDFFLKFAEKKKRAAISGSFGVETIADEWRQAYTDGLSGFAHLSVREEAGAKIIKELTGRDVPVLVDPTMLLYREEWRRVAKKPRADIAKPYVLKYYLGDEEASERIDYWAKDKGYAVFELLNENIPELYSAGPGEFLSLVANAALVASDSFHCIVFSILFQRPFVVYARQGACNYMTSRLDTLLGKFGFSHRWKHLLSPEQYLHCDFSQTDALLNAERKKALEYLQSIFTEKGL